MAAQPPPPPSAYVVTATAKVGRPGTPPRRIRLALHAFPVPTVSNADLEKNLRRRVNRWVRRVYAQAELAPEIVSFAMLEPPGQNLLVVRGDYESPTHAQVGGVKSAGGSQVTLQLLVDGNPRTEVVSLAADLDALGVGGRLAAALTQAGVAATALPVPKYETASPFNATHQCTGARSCDVLLTKTPGHTASLVSAVHDDRGLPQDLFLIPAVNIANPDKPMRGKIADDMTPGGSPEQRQLLRSCAAADDRIDIVVIPNSELGGRAFPTYETVTDADFRTADALRGSVLMAYRVVKEGYMDEAETNPFTLSHEVLHVMADTGHTGGEGDLMRPPQNKEKNSAAASKRIYSAPLLTGSSSLDSMGKTAAQPHSLQDMRADLLRLGAQFTSNW